MSQESVQLTENIAKQSGNSGVASRGMWISCVLFVTLALVTLLG